MTMDSPARSTSPTAAPPGWPSTRTADSSGAEAGVLHVGAGRFRTDRRAAPPIGAAALRLLARFHPVMFPCVPPGSGERLGVDRDGDGVWDGEARDAHTDPADPDSTP
jgi:hypothetical protein